MRKFYRLSKQLKKKENQSLQNQYEITPVDGIEISGKEQKEQINSTKPNLSNNIFYPVDEIEIVGKHHIENIKEPIDEIQIIGKEKIEGIIDPVDEIEIVGKELNNNNIFEPVDEIMIVGKDLNMDIINGKNNNIYKTNFEFQINPEININKIKKENKKDKALMALIDNNDSSIEERDNSDKENIDDNIDLNMNETENKKLKEINKLKTQLEKEKGKIKELVKKIIELESDMNEDKNKI